jgi:hypothetical protein
MPSLSEDLCNVRVHLRPRFVAGLALALCLAPLACGMRSALDRPHPGATDGTVVSGQGGTTATTLTVFGSGGTNAPGGGGRGGSGGVASPGTGGRPNTGGTTPIVTGQGGATPVDARPATGGAPGAGGGPPVDARPGTGGAGGGPPVDARPGTGGTGGGTPVDARPGTGGSISRDALLLYDLAPGAPGTPSIDDSGYVKLATGNVAMSGYVSSYIGGSGSTIALTYDASSFCASGTVGANTTYNSWAGAGFNVNQTSSAASGSTGSLILTGSRITVSYVNRGGSILELQLWDGSNYWCNRLPPAPVPAAMTIAFTSLNTKCWDGSGTAFKSGTPITTVQMVVPGSATTSTPYDFCFLGLTVE